MSLSLFPMRLITPEEIEASKIEYSPEEEVLINVPTESGWVYVLGRIKKRVGEFFYHVKIPGADESGADKIYDMIVRPADLKKYKPDQTS